MVENIDTVKSLAQTMRSQITDVIQPLTIIVTDLNKRVTLLTIQLYDLVRIVKQDEGYVDFMDKTKQNK